MPNFLRWIVLIPGNIKEAINAGDESDAVTFLAPQLGARRR
jgi:hypothetical protein